MGPSKRYIPFLLVGLVLLAAVGAAFLGQSNAPPSRSETAIQAAATQTMGASSFVFHTAAYGYSDPELTNQTNIGIWQSPNRIEVSNVVLHRTFTFIGTTVYVPARSGYTKLRYNVFGMNPFTEPFSSLTGLPALGLLSDAKSIALHGNTYEATIPKIRMRSDWIAYAPEAKTSSLPPPGPMAYNTPVSVVIRNGYVVRLTFPDGITSKKSETSPFSWTLTRFGTGPLVMPPRT
jgi:hypothetical protein